MEVVRHNAADPAGPAAPSDFRLQGLRARDMLRGDLTDAELEKYVEERVLTTTLDKAVTGRAPTRSSPPRSASRAARSR
jgi:NADH-quinone oxidoreductase subunit B